MSKKESYIIIAAIIILAGLIVPSWIWIRDFYISTDTRIDSNKLSEYATFQMFWISFLNLILNIILVYIAYRAFRNFGVKEQFHSKQLTVVTELASEMTSTFVNWRDVLLSKEIKTTTIFYSPNHGKLRLRPPIEGRKLRSITVLTLSFFEVSEVINYGNKAIFLKNENPERTFPFLRYRNNPILPPSIANKLRKIHRGEKKYLKSIKLSLLPESHVIISVEGSESYNKNNMFYEYYENPQLFQENCKALRISIIEWLKEYGADDINIPKSL